MKFTQLLDMNMVPEWRDQYLNYQELEATLNRAIESKHIRSREKGVNSYFELIKFDQKFADYFSQVCKKELLKINLFHREKLNEMKGKYNNLQDQLDQMLSSAIYREIQPDYAAQPDKVASAGVLSGHTTSLHDSNVYNKVTSISALFKSFKGKLDGCRLRATDGQNNNTNNNNNNKEQTRQNNNNKRYSFFASPNIVECNGFASGAKSSSRPSLAPLCVDSLRHNADSNNVIVANNGLRVASNMARRLSVSISHKMHAYLGNHDTSDNSDRASSCAGCPNGCNSDLCAYGDTLYSGSDPSTHIDMQHAQLVAGASPSQAQSKRKIVATYKKKINHLKFAFREFYFNLVLFELYTQLNHTGFEQILRKHDRMFASTLGRKFYQEHVQTADFYNDLQAIDHLIEGVEHVYTLHFENGNRRKAIEKLQVPSSVYKPNSPMLDFRVGYELGVFGMLFVLVLCVGLITHNGHDWRTIFRLYRSPLLIMLWLFQCGISIVIWKHYKINHVLIFELDPRHNLSFHHFLEFGSLLGIIWSISVLLFLFSTNLNIIPSLCPLIVIVIIFAYLFNPTATCYHRARFWLIRMLGRIMVAPFQPVRFADFWIADQLVSTVPLFLDLEYLSCFYTTGDVLSVSHLDAEFVNRCVTRNPQDLVIRTIFAAFPAWIRCAQCLRRWRDENWPIIHLANAGKYGCMVMVVVLSSASQFNRSSTLEFDTLTIVWMVAAIFTSGLCAFWDVYYDFGLFRTYGNSGKNDDDDSDDDSDDGKSKRRKSSLADGDSSEASIDFELETKKKRRVYPFLRKNLVYPAWVYYFAIVEDCILRFGWIITISLTEFSDIEAGLVVSLLAPLEMFRRFVWNCVRLENEQLNNCGMFRAVRDIPMAVVAPIDESHLDKVIMMMDGRDGPSMRHKLMKRRTLRPDRVSFMVLEPPDSPMPVIRRCDIRD